MLGVQLPVRQMTASTRGVNQHRKESSESYASRQQATEVLIKLELLPVTNYLPDFGAISSSGVKVIAGVSEYGLRRHAWYARVAEILAERLDTELVTFPGHHGSFMDKPDEFSAVLWTVLSP
jgi:hypothetical protein